MRIRAIHWDGEEDVVDEYEVDRIEIGTHGQIQIDAAYEGVITLYDLEKKKR